MGAGFRERENRGTGASQTNRFFRDFCGRKTGM